MRSGAYASDDGDGFNGAFQIKYLGTWLTVMASDGTDPVCEGWEHVSISTAKRTPIWEEMCFVKNLFWHDEECVIQFHPPKSEYVNIHPHVLHLWKRRDQKFELPPQKLL